MFGFIQKRLKVDETEKLRAQHEKITKLVMDRKLRMRPFMATMEDSFRDWYLPSGKTWTSLSGWVNIRMGGDRLRADQYTSQYHGKTAPQKP